MSDWLLNLPLLRMAVVVFAATYLVAFSIYWFDARTREKLLKLGL